MLSKRPHLLISLSLRLPPPNLYVTFTEGSRFACAEGAFLVTAEPEMEKLYLEFECFAGAKDCSWREDYGYFVASITWMCSDGTSSATDNNDNIAGDTQASFDVAITGVEASFTSI